jgi:predicted lipoprotein
MRLSFLVSFLAFGLAAFPIHANAEARTEQVLVRAVDEVIRPGYHRFETATGQLSMAMNTLCATPSGQHKDAARKAFREAVRAWGGIEFLRSGPALEKNRFERVLYYPDRKSIGLKQIQAILSRKDESATDAKALAGKSVGVQGLPALEFVLYGSGNDALDRDPNSHRCRYGAAVTVNMQTIASELSAAWDAPDGIAEDWKKPGTANPVFRTDDEAITELIGTMVHGIEMVRDQRIETFFAGRDQGRPANPKLAMLWRSQNTWVVLGANLQGLSDLWTKSRMESLLEEDQRSIASSIGFVLRSVTRAAPTIDPDVAAALASPEEVAKIDFLLLNTKDAITRISDDYGAALGIGAGFSFSDGD